MIHKLGNICDVAKLKHINVSVKETLLDYTSVLTNLYGEERDIDNDDGGYVLYCEKGTLPEDIKLSLITQRTCLNVQAILQTQTTSLLRTYSTTNLPLYS